MAEAARRKKLDKVRSATATQSIALPTRKANLLVSDLPASNGVTMRLLEELERPEAKGAQISRKIVAVGPWHLMEGRRIQSTIFGRHAETGVSSTTSYDFPNCGIDGAR